MRLQNQSWITGRCPESKSIYQYIENCRGVGKISHFSYLPWSNKPEAFHLGDLLQIWVQPSVRFTLSPLDFQGPVRPHQMRPEPWHFPGCRPLSWYEAIMGCPALHKEERTLLGAFAGTSGILCVTILDVLWCLSMPLQIQGTWTRLPSEWPLPIS